MLCGNLDRRGDWRRMNTCICMVAHMKLSQHYQLAILQNKIKSLIKKSLHTINAGEGGEKREPSYTVGGNVNWYNHYGEQYGGSLKKT